MRVKEKQRKKRVRAEGGKDKERWREDWRKERQRKEGGIGGGKNTKKGEGEERE